MSSHPRRNKVRNIMDQIPKRYHRDEVIVLISTVHGKA